MTSILYLRVFKRKSLAVLKISLCFYSKLHTNQKAVC